MLWKCWTQYASKFGKLSSGHRTGKNFIPVPKKGNAKECSNYHTIALISHTSKVMLKILQARLQQYMNCELLDVQAGFRKGRGNFPERQRSNFQHPEIIKKARESQKNIYFCFSFIPFLSFFVPISAGNVPLVSLIFLKRSLVIFLLLFSSISLHWSLRKSFLSLLAILWNSAFKWVYLSFFHCLLLLFFSQLFVRPPQTTILPFCISFSWGWSWSLPLVQCHEPASIVLQALCLSDLTPWISLSLSLFFHCCLVNKFITIFLDSMYVY